MVILCTLTKQKQNGDVCIMKWNKEKEKDNNIKCEYDIMRKDCKIMINWKYIPVCIFWSLVIVVGFAVVMGVLYSMIQAVYWLFSFIG